MMPDRLLLYACKSIYVYLKNKFFFLILSFNVIMCLYFLLLCSNGQTLYSSISLSISLFSVKLSNYVEVISS